MDYQDEDWEYIDDFPNFMISNYGRVINTKTGHIRASSVNAQGVLNLSMGGTLGYTSRSVAVLVGLSFVPGYTDVFNTITHLDGNYLNCRADNLVWRPRWYTIYYHKQFAFPMFQTLNQPVMETTLRDVYPSAPIAAMANGVHFLDVLRSCDNQTPVPITAQQFIYA